jgi:Fe-S-cluster-containing hydrogenase component 2
MVQYVITGRCVGCGACEGHCPVGAIHDGGSRYVISSFCTGCGHCVGACSIGAIVRK